VQCGQSKAHRPALPQVQVSVSVLDALGVRLTTTVVGGPCAEDPWSVPESKRGQHVLGAGGKPAIGDGTRGAWATRASVAASQDSSRCPWAGSQMPALDRAAWLEAGRHGAQPLEAVSDPAMAEREQPARLAEGSQVSVALPAAVHGQPVQGTARRLGVRSVAHATRQAARLDPRRRQAVAAIECLNARQPGQPRRSADQVHPAASTVLQRRTGQGVGPVDVRPTAGDTPTRTEGTRPAQVVRASDSTVPAQVDAAAVAAATQRLGGRV
jgi:hypothetical protein